MFEQAFKNVDDILWKVTGCNRVAPKIKPGAFDHDKITSGYNLRKSAALNTESAEALGRIRELV